MQGNRLTNTPTILMPSISLAEWCRDANQNPMARRMDRWYYVGRVGEQDGVCILQGADGISAWRMLDGTFQDYANWPENRAKGYRRWLSGCIEKGR